MEAWWGDGLIRAPRPDPSKPASADDGMNVGSMFRWDAASSASRGGRWSVSSPRRTCARIRRAYRRPCLALGPPASSRRSGRPFLALGPGPRMLRCQGVKWVGAAGGGGDQMAAGFAIPRRLFLKWTRKPIHMGPRSPLRSRCSQLWPTMGVDWNCRGEGQKSSRTSAQGLGGMPGFDGGSSR